MFARVRSLQSVRVSLNANVSRFSFRRHFSNSLPRIGFAGLGNMGGFMAANLSKAGYSLSVYDVSASASATLIERAKAFNNNSQISVVSSVSLLSSCPIIISMLPTPGIVKEVYLDNILPNLKAGQGQAQGQGGRQLFIDSSTIDPATAREVAAAALSAGVDMIDAPVSGGVGGAESGSLTFMVGGSDENYKVALPILQKMGKNIVHCGQNGNGQVAKIANNLVLAISMAAVSEGMNLGIELGMDAQKLAQIINTSSGRCWSSEIYNPVPFVVPSSPSSRGYLGGFGSSLMLKDLSLATQSANNSGLKTPLGDVTKKIYEEICNQPNLKTKDFSVVYQFIKDQNANKTNK